MKKYILPLILILCLAFTLIGDCWVVGYDQRIKLTIDYTKIDDTLTNFPVTAFFTDAQAEEIFAEFDADEDFDRGQFALDDDTLLKAEKELFDDSASLGIYHFKVPSVSSSVGTDIYFYYDNDADHNTSYIGIIGSATAAEVWVDYSFVCHGVDDTTSTVLDSTSNNNDGTKKDDNEPLQTVSGKVGFAQHYDGIDDYINLTDDSFESDSLGTIEAIINRDVAAKLSDNVLTSSELGATNLLNISTCLSAGQFLYIQHLDGAVHDIVRGDTALGDTEHYVAVTSNGSAWALYVDGAAEGLTEHVGSNTGDWFADLGVGTHKVKIGSLTYKATPVTTTMDGIIDEFRYSSVVRSAEWTKGTSNTLLDTLFTYGSEETEEEEANAIWFGILF